ncbi:MAG: LysM peptidoglycan-binding domain-containing protein [Litorilinea sp.]
MNIPTENRAGGHSSAPISHESAAAESDAAPDYAGDSTRRRSYRPPVSDPPAWQTDSRPATQAAAQQHHTPATNPRYRAGVRKCHGCDTYAYVTNGVCPECGEDLQLQPQLIRCGRCGEQANSELMICPHCARALKAAPSRMWTVGAPALLVLLFGVVLVGRFSGLSLVPGTLNNAGSTVTSSGAANSGAPLVMTPAPASVASLPVTENAATENVTIENAAADNTANESSVAAVEPEASAAQPDISTEETAGDSELAAALSEPISGTDIVSDNAPNNVPDGAVASSDVISDVDGAAAAEPGSLAESVVAAVLDEQVQATPESRGIGGLAGSRLLTSTSSTSTVEDAEAGTSDAASNDDLDAQAASLVLPTPTPGTPEEPAGELADNPVIDYEVQPGDTVVGIASRHGTTADDILALNSMSEQDAFGIRAGDVLSVPDQRLSQRTQTPAATATPVPEIQARAASMESSSTGDADDYRLAAPLLRSPGDGSVLDCDATERLSWSPVPYMDVSDRYVLHLGFVAGRQADGSERITWVLAQPRPANLTTWELDNTLCSLAPDEYGRQWRWWVEATEAGDGQTQAVSPPSAIWTFIWN